MTYVCMHTHIQHMHTCTPKYMHKLLLVYTYRYNFKSNSDCYILKYKLRSELLIKIWGKRLWLSWLSQKGTVTLTLSLRLWLLALSSLAVAPLYRAEDFQGFLKHRLLSPCRAECWLCVGDDCSSVFSLTSGQPRSLEVCWLLHIYGL